MLNRVLPEDLQKVANGAEALLLPSSLQKIFLEVFFESYSSLGSLFAIFGVQNNRDLY